MAVTRVALPSSVFPMSLAFGFAGSLSSAFIFFKSPALSTLGAFLCFSFSSSWFGLNFYCIINYFRIYHGMECIDYFDYEINMNEDYSEF